MKNLSAEDSFLRCFDSIKMIGWNTYKDFDFYWKCKQVSSILIGTGTCYLLMSVLGINGKNTNEYMYLFLGLFPISITIGLLIYIFMDRLFQTAGNNVAKSHARLVWGRNRVKLINIINQCDSNIVSDSEKLLVKNSSNKEEDVSELLIKIWNKSLVYVCEKNLIKIIK